MNEDVGAFTSEAHDAIKVNYHFGFYSFGYYDWQIIGLYAKTNTGS